MSLRKLAWLFWTTLWIGAAAGLAIGLGIGLGDAEFRALAPIDLGTNLVVMAMAGMMFSVLSQMVFFAYMTLNYIAREMFRKPSTWVLIQLFFIMTVPFELWFLWSESLGSYVLGVGFILAVSLGISWWKMKQTNPSAFIPTLFFMFVATLLETAIALKIDTQDAALYNALLVMAVPLLACNAWQIMKLHRLVAKE